MCLIISNLLFGAEPDFLTKNTSTMKNLFLFTVCFFVSFLVFGQVDSLDLEEMSWEELNRKFEEYYYQDDLTTSLLFAKRAVLISKREFGEKHKLYFNSMGNLAHVHALLENFDAALPMFEETRNLIQESLGKKHKIYGDLMVNMASCYETIGQFEKALEFYNECLDNTLLTIGKDTSEYGSRLNKLAVLYLKMGITEQGLPLLLEAIENGKKYLGEDSFDFGIYLNNLAIYYLMSGEYERALPLILKTLRITENTVGKDHLEYGINLSNLGLLYFNMGKYEKALPVLLECLANTEKTLGKEHSEYGISLNNLASLYQSLGQFDKAINFSKQALEITEKVLGKDHPEYANILTGLGFFYSETKSFDAATQVLNEALEIIENSLGKDHLSYIDALQRLARVNLEIGKYEVANRLFLTDLEICQKKFGKFHDQNAQILLGLARSYQKMNLKDKAVSSYLEALEVIEKVNGKNHEAYGICLNDLAGFYHSQKNYTKAKPFYIQAFKNYSLLIHQLYPSLSEGERIKFLQTHNQKLNQGFSFAIKNPTISSYIQDILLTVKGMALGGSIESKKTIFSLVDSSLIEKYYDLKILRRKMNWIYTLSEQEKIEHNVNLDSLQNRATLLEGELSRASSALAAQFDPDKKRQITFQDLKEELAENEATIEFLHFQYYNGNEWTDSILYCALLTRPGYEEPKFITLTEDKTLQKILKTSVAQQSDNYITNLQKGYELWQLLWKPIEPHLEGITKIHLSPSGLLHQVAFDALPTQKEGKQILADEYELAYHGTLRDFVLKKSYGDHGKSITLVGGAEYDLDSVSLSGLSQNFDTDLAVLPREEPLEIGGIKIATRSIPEDSTRNAVHFGYLPGTKEEVTNIARQFQQQNWQVKTYTDKQALEDRVKAESSEKAPAILHLATHGYFFKPFEGEEKYDNTLRERIITSENPLLRSGLVFTGVNHTWQGGQPIPGMEDGVLTAYEISNLDLLNTNLVVLSACETGLGDVHDAEGVFGLQRAFKTAGVENLIVSLWKVPDEQTSELMQHFYKNYLEGDSVRTAFRKAQRVMREKVPPFYWAGFILIE